MNTVELETSNETPPVSSKRPQASEASNDAKIQESETEDEEVKLNCFGGVRENRDSDMDTLGEESEDASLADDEAQADDEQDKNWGVEQEGIVRFVKSHWENPHSETPPLLKPKPVVSKSPVGITNEGAGSVTEEHDDGSHQLHPDLGERSVREMTEDIDEDVIEVLHDSTASAEDRGGIGFANEDCEPSFIELLTEMEQDVVRDQKSRTISFDTDPWNFDSGNGQPPAFSRIHKRARSLNSLIPSDSNEYSTGSPKRFCGPLTFLPSVVLGQQQTGAIDANILPIRHRSPYLSSEDEAEMDKRLGEELLQKLKGDEVNRENQLSPPPVPLLTPPQSPLTIPAAGEAGGTATLCEWPSNLAVDLALREATDLRPMTPESLQKFEYDEEARVANQKSCPNNEVSLLTPLLQGIYVGLE